MHVTGPQISKKNGQRIVAGKWARNLVRPPGSCFKFGEGSFFSHEIVAKKWAQKLDRVFSQKTHSEPQTWTRTGVFCRWEAIRWMQSFYNPKHVGNVSGPKKNDEI